MRGRRAIDFGVGGLDTDDGAYVEYANVPRSIATVVSAKMATLHELDTVYGLADLYRMLEVLMVDGHNQRVANKPRT